MKRNMYAISVNGEYHFLHLRCMQAYFIAAALWLAGFKEWGVKVEKTSTKSSDLYSVYIGRVEAVCMIPLRQAKLIAFALHLCGVKNTKVIHF